MHRAGVLVAEPMGQSKASPGSLTERACAGDPAALQALVRRELPRVEGLLRRLLGPRADMDDLVQTVFLEMCRALPGFRGESQVSTFIGGIAVRVARRAMRPTAWVRFSRPMPEELPAGPDRPEANAVANEQLRRLDQALGKLTPAKRTAFVLWAIDGLEMDAVAKTMGASVAATRSRIYFAQKELKAAAQADPYLRELVGGPDDG